MKQFFLLFIILSCTLPISAFGAIDIKVVNLFTEYLSNIKQIEVEFTQTDSQSQKAAGKLLISKPYKFRCNYYPPFPLLIIGNKNYVSVYDYDMEQVSRINASENLFNFLLTEKVQLEKHFTIESAIENGDTIEVVLYHNDSERRSQINMNKYSKQITMIRVFEDDNIITINLGTVRQVKSFDEDLFIIKNPDIFGPPSRLTKVDIEKKYILAS